jgi:predicted metal-dependent enzyme (double-stranded beta helix superfamily)
VAGRQVAAFENLRQERIAMDKNSLRHVRQGSEPEGQLAPELAVRRPTLSAQPDMHRATPTGQARAFADKRQVEERAAVARFTARVNALGPLSHASSALQARLLEEVKTVARHIDGSGEAGVASGYDRRVLYEDSDRWSLAAIILRPGQQTHPHDHGGWGCAVTVQGVERNRWFVHDASGNLVLSSERDYPPGTGYVFDAADIHQPVGADPRRVTVALHFLVHESHAEGPQG